MATVTAPNKYLLELTRGVSGSFDRELRTIQSAIKMRSESIRHGAAQARLDRQYGWLIATRLTRASVQAAVAIVMTQLGSDAIQSREIPTFLNTG